MVHFDLKSPEFLLFLGGNIIIFCRNFPKIEHIFYFIRFRSCCNLLNNWFISFFDLTNFLFFFDQKSVFFSKLLTKKYWKINFKIDQNCVPKTYSKMEKKLNKNWPQKLKSQFGPDRNYESSCWGGKHVSKIAQPDYPIWLGAKFFQK